MGRPLITVFGAGGFAGHAVALALLQALGRPWRVRAVLREPGACMAQTLAGFGAEILLADPDEPASLRRALLGAHAAFCTAPRGGPPLSRARAQAMADALRQSSLEHVVWCGSSGSSLQVGRGLGVELSITLLLQPFLWEWLLHAPQRDAEGWLQLRLPMGRRRLPGIGAADFGLCVAALFRRPPAARGRTLWLAAERLDGSAIARGLGSAFGEPVQFLSCAGPAASGCARASRAARRAVAQARRLQPALMSFDAWASSAVHTLQALPSRSSW